VAEIRLIQLLNKSHCFSLAACYSQLYVAWGSQGMC